MTEKEKQIEEMAFSICPMPQASEYITDCTKCGGNGDCIRQKFAAKFLGKGYRKQSEVAKEFVDRLILELIALRSEEFDGKELAINGKTYKYLVMRAKEIAAEYGVEVEK